MRGRSRNKGPNPLTRSYESNGPDVKVRGTAQHVADKYAQLARDAQVSGDPVAAENYFQHAEHYYRLIATAQEALRQQYGGGPRAFDEDGDEGDEDGGPNGYGYPGDRVQGVPPMDESEFGVPQQQQPYDTPRGGNSDREQRYERNERPGQDRGPERQGQGQDRGPDRNQQRFDRNGGGERFDRPNGNQQQRPDNNRFDNNRPANGRQDRNERFDRNDQRPRYPRNDQPRGDYQRQDGQRGDAGHRGDAPPRAEAARPDYARDEGSRGDGTRGEAPRRDYQRDEAPDLPVAAALPAFLTNPVRPPVAFGEEPEAGPAETNGAAVDDFAPERPRRRARTRRPAGEGGPAPELAGEGETPAE